MCNQISKEILIMNKYQMSWVNSSPNGQGIITLARVEKLTYRLNGGFFQCVGSFFFSFSRCAVVLNRCFVKDVVRSHAGIRVRKTKHDFFKQAQSDCCRKRIIHINIKQ